MRADDETRQAYTAELQRIISEIASGLPARGMQGQSETRREDRAILLLAMLSGGVTLARAVSDPALSERIANIIAQAALLQTK
jgi:TetR/AcrR family transcriptional regulator, transcriptional repressor for nem operon